MKENHSFGCIEDQIAMGLHDMSKAQVYQEPKEMTEEEYFRKYYPDSCYGDKPLSPHWDFFQDGVEFGERQSEKKIAELEKENAELKSDNQKWKDEWQEQVQKATDEGYARTLQTIQLSKAKEIIKKLLSAYTSYADDFDDRDNEIVDEAVQFLNKE